jgi:serine/threonine-protein kinase PknK
MPQTRVVLAEDDVLLREGLATVLERSGFEVIAKVDDAEALLRACDEVRPNLVVTDIRMPPGQSMEGLVAAHELRRRFPDLAIVVLSAHVEAEHAMTLLDEGHGVGYILKSRVTRIEEFVESVRHVANGGTAIDPELVHELLRSRRRNDPLASLTRREREVLALMAEGRSNAGIAKQLWVTEGTVEKHIQSVLGKLGIDNTADDHRRVRAVVTYLEAN